MEESRYVDVTYGGDLSGVVFDQRYIDCSFVSAILRGAHLSGVFIGCDFSNTDLSTTVMTGRFIDCTFNNAVLPGGMAA